ncbi:uncharacterized protein LOC114841200 [Diachasma alloeum]|uniref:uncharacterized protein LOC114841200 n=1 Tax=Diachasma alloeum TaxID=454923 RepID=UPI0010FB1178|nr:uncharacterized protein LOC114841200 [Diachasma alloeum]
MLGRDIEIKARKKIREEPKIFMNELAYGVPQKNSVRPPSVPTVGMSKIQAKGWKAFFIEYASSASFHGLNHLAAPRRHLFERIGTVVIIIMSLVALVLLSLHFWEEYQNYPIVIILNHGFHNYKIVQPAIVVCTKSGVDEEKFPEVFKKYGIEDTEELRKFFMVISREPYSYKLESPETVSVPSSMWLSILNDLKPEIEDVYKTKDASWVITEWGFCNSFCSYAAPYSSFDYWMSDNWTVIPEPPELPFYEHLSPIFNLPIHVTAYDVFISFAHPGNIVDFTRITYLAKLQWRTELAINTEEIEPSSEIRSLSFKQRNCKFHDEHKLTMWPIYTYAMCKRECVYRRMFKLCGCHHHFARPVPGVPTCDLAQLRCAAKNIKAILGDNNEGAGDCGCLHDCHFIRYTEGRVRSYFLGERTPMEVTLDVTFQFPKDKYINEQVFGFVDFLAAVGGAAGLLLGASILSFAEFFYFATLRCFWYYRKMRSERIRKLRNKRNSLAKIMTELKKPIS